MTERKVNIERLLNIIRQRAKTGRHDPIQGGVFCLTRSDILDLLTETIPMENMGTMMQEHISKCPYCFQTMAYMIREYKLELPKAFKNA